MTPNQDTERLDWLEENAHGVDKSGYGHDDYWWTVLYNDGQRGDGATLRAAIDSARSK